MTTQLGLFDQGVDTTARVTRMTLKTLHVGDTFTYKGRQYTVLKIHPTTGNARGSLLAASDRIPGYQRVFYDLANFEQISGYQVAVPEGAPQKKTLHIGDVFMYHGREYELLEIRAPLDEHSADPMDAGALVAFDRDSLIGLRRVINNIALFEELSGYTVAMEEAT